jgi:hypothetical protein
MGKTYAGLDKRGFDSECQLSNHVAWKETTMSIFISLSDGIALPYKLETSTWGRN